MNNKWIVSEIKAAALQYNTRKEFRKKNPKAYSAAFTREILQEVCRHMTLLHHRKRNKEDLLKEALKYNYRSEFKKSCPGGYKTAIKMGILDEICSHMSRMTYSGSLIRNIYCYFFSDNSVYVGLSGQLKRRHRDHLKDPKSTVFQAIKKGLSYKLKIVEHNVPQKEASAREEFWKNHFLSERFTIRNKAKCGSLGGNKTKWTKEAVAKIASSYHNLKSFREENSSAYAAMIKNGWIKDFPNLKSKKTIWSKLDAEIEALKYKTITEFIKYNRSAYTSSYNHGWLDEICSHMPRRLKNI